MQLEAEQDEDDEEEPSGSQSDDACPNCGHKYR